jgi:hypothetical protein
MVTSEPLLTYVAWLPPLALYERRALYRCQVGALHSVTRPRIIKYLPLPLTRLPVER